MSDRVIYKNQWVNVPEIIPDDCHKCPDCKGEGEIRIGYDGGHHKDFMQCMFCMGKGYLSPDDMESWENFGSQKAKDKIAEMRKPK